MAFLANFSASCDRFLSKVLSTGAGNCPRSAQDALSRSSRATPEKQRALLIRNAALVATVDDEELETERGCVLIEGDRIAQIGVAE